MKKKITKINIDGREYPVTIITQETQEIVIENSINLRDAIDVKQETLDDVIDILRKELRVQTSPPLHPEHLKGLEKALIIILAMKDA